MEGKALGEVTSGKGVEVGLKFSAAQCLDAYSSANKTLGLLKRTLRLRNPKVMVTLYKSLVKKTSR